MIEAVVFDLDGTLVDLPVDYERLFAEFKEIMHVHEVRPVVDTVSKVVDEKIRALVFAAWDRAELAVLDEVSVNGDGMRIYQANANKHRALVTLQGKAVVDAIVKRFGLLFDVVMTREDSLFRVDQLSKAVEQLNLNILDVLFVGDAESDAVAAAKLGCQFLKIG